jgi:type IV pilus assembly protein PilC
MPVYKYVGRDVLDRRRKGIVEADSIDMARELLFDRGIVVIEKIKEEKPLFRWKLENLLLGKVSLKELIVFTRQLYAMVHAGIPLVQALRIIREQVPNKAFKRIIDDVASFVEEGGKFSTALSKYKSVFGELYISMVRAAEEAGTLEDTLKRLSEYLEKVERLRNRVKSALFYPTFVLAAASLIIAGILIFVIPTFQQLYSDLGGELPALTQAVIKLSNWLRNNIGRLIVIAIFFVISILQARKIKKIKYLIDYLLLRVPIIGGLILKSSIANFARTLSSTISSGVNILDAIQISGETANNEVIRRAVQEIRRRVEKGTSLSTAMSSYPIFPPLVVNMVAIGEQTGNLDEMLSKVADFYEEEVDRTVDSLTSLIEPILVVFIGLVIGTIIMAMYLPIFKIGELLR